MALPEFQLLRPKTIQSAVTLLAQHKANDTGAGRRYRSAAVDEAETVCAEVCAGHSRHRRDQRIRVLSSGLEIGALMTLSQIEDSEFIRRSYPVLRKAAMTVASPILRNMGTIGGNICLDTRCLWYNQSYAWRTSCGFCIKKDGDLCHVAPGGK